MSSVARQMSIIDFYRIDIYVTFPRLLYHNTLGYPGLSCFSSHTKTSKNAIYCVENANNGGFGIGSN
jgi:hypothetical protein